MNPKNLPPFVIDILTKYANEEITCVNAAYEISRISQEFIMVDCEDVITWSIQLGLGIYAKPQT